MNGNGGVGGVGEGVESFESLDQSHGMSTTSNSMELPVIRS